MLGRVLVLIGALLVAIIGTGLVYLYVQGAIAKGLDEGKGTLVYVAVKDVPAGTTVGEAISGGLIDLQEVPPRLLEAQAFSTVTPDQETQKITRDLGVNHQLVAADLEQAGASDPLGVGSDNALQVQISDPQRVSGFVTQGSNVAVYVTFAPGVADNDETCTQLLIDTVKVLQIGTAPVSAKDPVTGLPVANGTSVTLQVDGTSDLGQRLIQAQANGGSLYFLLVGGEKPPPETPYEQSDRCMTTRELAEDPISAGKQTS